MTRSIVSMRYLWKLLKQSCQKRPKQLTTIKSCLQKQKTLYQAMLRSGKKEALGKYKCKIQNTNTLKRLIRHRKSEYFLAKCTAFKNNSKKLWGLINRTISKSHNKLDSIDKIKVENIYKADAQSITSAFCNHFSKVGKSYADKISKSNRKIEDYIRNIEINNHSLFLTPISESD